MSGDNGSPALFRLGRRLYLRHWRQMLFFSACIAIGIAFLFSIDNLLATLERGVALRARELMAADVEVSANRPFEPKVQAVFAGLFKEGVRGAEVLSFASMLKTPDAVPFLVSVKAVEPGYPFYGKVVAQPEDYESVLFGPKPACLIEEAIALQHGVKAGDTVELGRSRLLVAAVLLKEPDRALTSFSLGPRVLVPLSVARDSGLIQFGSRIQYQRLLALPPNADPTAAAKALKARLENDLKDPYLRVTTYDEAASNTREALQRSTTFFVLVSLIGLILGGIGMASSITIFLNEQLETAGVLRCLGLGPFDIAGLYGGLCLAIGLQGGLMGAGAGWLLSRFSLSVVRRVVGLRIEAAPYLSLASVVQALALACVLTLGINFGKLRALTVLAPLDALRERVKGLPSSRSYNVAALIAGLAAIFGYTWLKADSLRVARDFSLALVGAAVGISALTGLALQAASWGVALYKGSLPFSLRHGLLQLTRQRGRTVVFLTTLSAGFSLLGALGLVHHSLSKEIMLGRAADVPDMFLIDVQKNQVDGISSLVSRYSRDAAEFAPLVHARLTHVNGVALAHEREEGMSEDRRSRRRMLAREYNLTYKDTLHPSETLAAGRFWSKGEATPQISMEEEFAKRAGFKLNDVLRFDVQGRPVEGPITSLRAVEWTAMKPNFFVIMPKAALEKAPQVFIASMKTRGEEENARFRTELVNAFPNVSAIDIKRILESVSAVLETLLKALTMLAWFCVGVGLLVLAGTLSLGRKERGETAALLRALGCSAGGVARIDAWEFAAIGVITYVIACVTSYGLGYALSKRMDIKFSSDPKEVLTVLAAALLLPLAVGLAVNWRAYRGDVMENLRGEV
jgi:putative ABC transport system permease protein